MFQFNEPCNYPSEIFADFTFLTAFLNQLNARCRNIPGEHELKTPVGITPAVFFFKPRMSGVCSQALCSNLHPNVCAPQGWMGGGEEKGLVYVFLRKINASLSQSHGTIRESLRSQKGGVGRRNREKLNKNSTSPMSLAHREMYK